MINESWQGTSEWLSDHFSPEGRASAYHEMVRRAELLGRMGESVVIDATWSSAPLRALADKGARNARCALVALRCDVSAKVAEHRVARRIAAGTDISTATVAIARQLSESFEPWPAAVVISTEGRAEEAQTHAVGVISAGAARFAPTEVVANGEPSHTSQTRGARRASVIPAHMQ